MLKRPLGNTGEEISEIGLGGVWFSKLEKAADYGKVIRRAVDLGVTMFDTAPGYKDSEEVLGKALADLPRERLFVSTKYYPYGEGGKLLLSAKDFVRGLAKSLLRLNCGWFDAVYLHWVHNASDIEKILNSELAQALKRFQATGHLRYIGVSEASEMDGEHKMLARALEAKFFDLVMVTYNLLLQTAEENVFPLARETGTGVVVMMPLNQAMGNMGLTSSERGLESVRQLAAKQALPKGEPFNRPDLLDFLTRDQGRSLPQAALRFVLDRPEVSCALVGTSSVAHLEENVAASAQPVLPEPVHARARELFGKVKVQVK